MVMRAGLRYAGHGDGTARAELDTSHALLAIVVPDRTASVSGADIIHRANLGAKSAGITLFVDVKFPGGIFQ